MIWYFYRMTRPLQGNYELYDAATPEDMMTVAEDGFTLARTSDVLDANRMRMSAAAMLELGAAKLVHEKFQSFGLTDSHMEDLAAAGRLEEIMAAHAAGELRVITERVQRITQTDLAAKAALGSMVYYTEHVLGRMQRQ